MIGEYDDENCPVDATIQLLTNKSLSRCLKNMENTGLIEKIVTDSNIEYKLSEKGLGLNKVLYELIIFSIDNDENESYDKNKIKESYKELLNL